MANNDLNDDTSTWNSLTVVKLKEVLKKNGLSVFGMKAVLIKRLIDSKIDPATSLPITDETAQDKQPQQSAQVEDTVKQTVTKPATSALGRKRRKAPTKVSEETSPSKKANLEDNRDTTEARETSQKNESLLNNVTDVTLKDSNLDFPDVHSSSEIKDSDLSNKNLESSEKKLQKHDSKVNFSKQNSTASKIYTEQPPEQPTMEPTMEPTAEPTTEPAMKPTMELTMEPTMEPNMEPTMEPTVEPTVESTVEVEPPKQKKSQKIPENTIQPEENADYVVRGKSPSPQDTTIVIRNFTRPLTLETLKDELSSQGNVIFFWLDRFRTHCYVTYETRKQAETAQKKYNGLKYPPDIGKVLTSEFINKDLAHKNISEIENKQPSGRIPVVPPPDVDKSFYSKHHRNSPEHPRGAINTTIPYESASSSTQKYVIPTLSSYSRPNMEIFKSSVTSPKIYYSYSRPFEIRVQKSNR